MNHDNIKRHDRDIFDAQAKPDVFHSSSLAAIMHEKQREWFATWITSHPKYEKGLKIADIGCGGGSTMEWLGTYGEYTIGLDHSMVRVKNAGHKLPDRTRFQFLLADGEMPPFIRDSLDIVFCTAILHHFPAYRSALDSYSKCLSNDGIFIAAEPCAFNPFAIIRRKYFPAETHTPDEKPFAPRELVREFKRIFDVVHYKRFYLFSVNSSLVEKILGRKSAMVYYKIFSQVDRILLKIPLIKELCWIVCLVGCMKANSDENS